MLKKIILVIPILILGIYIFQMCLEAYDVVIIKNSIDNHLSDKNNINEINYTLNPYGDKKIYKIPWGINKSELKILMQYKMFNENEESISFPKDGNFIFYFNRNEQFYHVKQLSKIDYSSKDSELSLDYWSTSYSDIEIEYLDNIDIDGIIQRNIIEFAWKDDSGKIQTRVIASQSLPDFSKIMNLESDYDYTLDKLVMEKELIVKRIWKYNNTNLEFSVKKYDETSAVFEFVIENTSLKDKI